MKRILKILVVIVLLVAAFLGYASFTRYQTESETLELVTEAVIAISNPWNAAELERRFYPAALESAKNKNQSPQEIFRIYEKLGGFNQLVGCKLLNVFSTFEYAAAQYNCNADYQNGKADITIVLRKDDGQNLWQITDLHIDSPLFSELLKQ